MLAGEFFNVPEKPAQQLRLLLSVRYLVEWSPDAEVSAALSARRAKAA